LKFRHTGDSPIIKLARDPNELGHPAPISFIMGRNGVAAVGITGFICYHNGFELRLIGALSSPDNSLSPLLAMDEQEGSGHFHFAIRFADGSVASSSGLHKFRTRRGAEVGESPSLTLLRGTFDGQRCDLNWFVEPLPPVGPVLFECEWVNDQARFQSQIDSSEPIIAAAGRAQRILLPSSE
jgi:hypothetical protein